jgi:hypothetical protein
MSKGKYKHKREQAKTREQEKVAQTGPIEGEERYTENQTKSAAARKNEGKNSKEDSKMSGFWKWAGQTSLTDRIIAFFTAVLAAAAIYQFIIMNSQLDTMRKDQRPWIKVTFTPSPLQVLTPVGGIVHLVNNGKTPARSVRGDFAVESVKNGDQVEFHNPHAHVVTMTGMITPNDVPIDVQVERKKLASDGNTLESDPLTASEVKNLQPQINIFFVVYGKVSYSDFFGIDHWTKFCQYMVPTNSVGSVTAERCANYGDVDSN